MNQKNDTVITPEINIDETTLFEHTSSIIETRKYRASAYANQEMTLMFWDVGKYINPTILNDQRAAYGKKILATLSTKLTTSYGKGFTELNLYRMARFAERFTNDEILATLSTKLSWSHIIELLPLRSENAQSTI